MTSALRWQVALVLAPVLGFLCFLLPIFIVGNAGSFALPESVNIVSRVYGQSHLSTLALLAFAGFGLRYFAGKGTWVLAILMVVVFPIATLYGVLMEPEQHNLFPFELVSQLACLLPALLGTGVASLLEKRVAALA